MDCGSDSADALKNVQHHTMKFFLSLLFVTFLCTGVRAQIQIINDPAIDFSNGLLPEGWTLTPSAPDIARVSADGTASAIDPNWSGRLPINSASGSPAVAMSNNESGGGVIL